MKDGGSAFPRPAQTVDQPGGSQIMWFPSEGMSLRDYFAAAALKGYGGWNETTIEFTPQLASFGYDVAEAMIAERESRMQSDEGKKT